MFNGLVKKVKRNQIIFMVIFLILSALFLFLSSFGIIHIIKGPKKVNLYNNDIKDYVNKYIEVNVYHPIDMFEEDYVKNTDTNTTRVTHYGYVIMNPNETYADFNLCGIMVPDEYENVIYDIAEESYNFLASGELLPTYKPFVVKGIVIKMDSTQLRFYNESLSALGMETVSEAYYVAHKKLPGNIDITTSIIFTVIAGVFLFFTLLMLFFVLTNRGLNSIKKYATKKTTKSVEQLDYEFQSARLFGKNIWVTKDNIFTSGVFSVKIVDLNDVVWAYYYKKTGKHPQSYVRMYNTKKRMLYVNAPEAIAYEILEYLDQITSHMVLGYSKELNTMFNRDFNGFLNLKYNAPQPDYNEMY